MKMRIVLLIVALSLFGFFGVNEIIKAQKKLPIPVPDANPPKPEKVSDLSKQNPKPFKQRKISVEKRLEDYFYGRKISPLYVVNNPNEIGYENRLKYAKYPILNHTFEWLSVENEVKFKIDDELISLKGKKTLNDNEEIVEVFADNWRQIKFYKFEKDDFGNERELIGIDFFPSSCTGTGCSVSNYLVYDFKTKSKTFFGGFSRLIDYDLYSFANKNRKTIVDFVSTSFDGDFHGVTSPREYTYTLYSMNEKGFFEEQKSNKGIIFNFKHIVYQEETNKPDKLIQNNWIEKIR